MAALPQPRYTPAEYLALEREASYKSEYIDGYIYAMAGTSADHNLITLNIAGELRAQLKGKPCRVYGMDVRVKVKPMEMYTYPDVAALCGEPQFEDAGVDTLLNPQVIIEVLSPSTERYDRGLKFRHYRQLATLTDYVLIAQDRMSIEHYVRQDAGWLLTEFTAADETLHLAALGCAVALRDIYDKVTFTEPPPDMRDRR